MKCYTFEIPLKKLKESLLSTYFDEKDESSIRLYVCKECQIVVFSSMDLSSHLRKHPEIWFQYLDNLAVLIKPKIIEVQEATTDSLKLVTTITEKNTGNTLILYFPISRKERDVTKLEINEHLQGFHGRLQTQYNYCIVGPFAGPYDQNKCLPLSIQIPGTDLNYDEYTSFRHSDEVSCKKFIITDSYDDVENTAKIDSLAIANDIECESEESDDSDSESDSDSDEKIVYTCQKKMCRIPCPCSLCNGKEQCDHHKLKHEELFDEENDMVIYRSNDLFCQNKRFFESGYTITYPGIPIQCKNCQIDFLHHISYHFDQHWSCKFCRKNMYKTYAKSVSEFKESLKKHEYYLKCVCPFCGNTFCEPYFRKKHVQFEHEGNDKFACNLCTRTFHSKQGLDYHHSTSHSSEKETEKFKCEKCGKQFSAKVTFSKHIKYAHSETRRFNCSECDSRFKQKSDMRAHMNNVHGYNLGTELFGNLEETKQFKCELCESTFKYKKDLNQHIRLVHETTFGPSSSKTIKCDECDATFTMLKNLNAHKKVKHSKSPKEFSCSTCGKIFHKKGNLKRHEGIHETSE